MGHTPNADRISSAMREQRQNRLRAPVASASKGAGRKKRLIVISDSEDEESAQSERDDGGDEDFVEQADESMTRPDEESDESAFDGSDSALDPDLKDRPSKRRKTNINTASSKITKPARASSKVTTSKLSTSTSILVSSHSHSPSHHSSSQLSSSAPLLLDWFDKVRDVRGMPWRKMYVKGVGEEERGRRAYEVWVSEVMLQQTQVATVIPYWTRWMERWPGVEDLAGADVEEVNSAWRGLGYYRRARSLLEGAKKIMANSSVDRDAATTAGSDVKPAAAAAVVEDAPGNGLSPAAVKPDEDIVEADTPQAIDLTGLEETKTSARKAKTPVKARARVRSKPKEEEAPLDFHGRLPDDVGMMEKHIPGVGRYTAGAICSIAYGKRVPIVDGNINRLLSRVLAIHLPSDSPGLAKQLWAATTELLDSTPSLQEEGRAGDWNQALMELGSQVCKPVGPDCGSCCLKSVCKAYAETTSLPAAADGPACKACEPFAPSELTEIGSAISDVKIYPMKKASAKGPREESTAVCVLRWVPAAGNGGEERWLFVKRPEKGLLAGLFEPPSVPLCDLDGNGTDRLAQCKAYIKDELLANIESSTEIASAGKGRLALPAGNYLGEYLHIFSHIRMTYHVHLLTLQGPPGDLSPPSIRPAALMDGRVVWLSKDQVGKANVGTGVKRIWDMVYGKQSVWAGEGDEKAEKRIAKRDISKRVVKVEQHVVTESTQSKTVRKTVIMPGMKLA